MRNFVEYYFVGRKAEDVLFLLTKFELNVVMFHKVTHKCPKLPAVRSYPPLPYLASECADERETCFSRRSARERANLEAFLCVFLLRSTSPANFFTAKRETSNVGVSLKNGRGSLNADT